MVQPSETSTTPLERILELLRHKGDAVGISGAEVKRCQVELASLRYGKASGRTDDARLRLALDAARMGTWERDLVSGQDRWSARQEMLFGLAPGSFPGTHEAFVNLVHADDRVMLEQASTRAIAGQAPYRTEYRVVWPDGSTHWMSGRGDVIRDAQGQAIWMVGITMDITKRKVAEAQVSQLNSDLQRSVGELETLFEIVPVGIAVAQDPECRTIHGNRVFMQMLGLEAAANASLSAPVGERPTSFRCMRDGKELAADQLPMQIAAATGRSVSDFGFDIVFDDGRVLKLLEKVSPLFDNKGNPRGAIGAFWDVTSLREAEEARAQLLHSEQRARAQVEAASRMKDQFLAVLSHELRTPLTPVVARLDLLCRKPDLPKDVRASLEMICRNVELEARLIDDLLDMTRIARGQISLSLQTIDAHQEIRHALDIYHRDIVARHLQLSDDLQAQQHHVRADPVRLQQVFWNLIGNAVKYTPRGGSIAICSTSPAANRLRIEVRDSGIGIEPELMPRLFSAFEQGEQTLSRHFGGLGLGLSISRHLAEMMGGTLTAQSAGSNKGATFTVELPTGPPLAPQAEAVAQPPAKGVGRVQRPLRVLLVEDNHDTLKVLSRLLRSDGYQVKTATSVKDAVAVAGKNEFDLLISDIGLPDGTGWDLMRTLSSNGPVKGIALSGFAMQEDIQKSKAVGFAQHLIKPISPKALEAAMEQVSD